MAGFEPKEKEIAGSKFVVSPLPFGKGREGLLKLLAIVAPAIGEALRGASVTALLAKPTLAGMLADALVTLPQRLDEPTMKWFENEFGSRTVAEVGEVKAPLKLDTETNRAMCFESLGYMAFFQWLGFALEVNYSGFFGEALAALPKKPDPKQPAPTK